MSRTPAEAYFDNPAVWDPAAWQHMPEQQERARLADEWLPAEVSSVLDIGCGNGIYTRHPASSRSKVGLDLSLTALRLVGTARVQATAARLPFGDGQFDAAVSMEMLEHLPLPIYQVTLDEILRVSRSYILITVPYNENLAYSLVTCPACHGTFHPYQHVRSFSEAALQHLFASRAHLLRLEGILPTQRRAFHAVWNLVRAYKHRRGRNFPAGSVCPQCGYTVELSTHSPGSRGSQPSRQSWGRFWPQATTCTWWMALYRKGS